MATARTDDTPRPDLREGIPTVSLEEGAMLLGRVGEDEIVLARTSGGFFAFGAHCTHYHGPLAQGLIVGDTIRCPWHHACFSLKTGDAVRAPALDPIACWRVEVHNEKVFVGDRVERPVRAAMIGAAPASIVIVGGGGAGLAAADMLRREGYDGPITMLSADEAPPVDRPNLSKDYLAGEAQEDWIPLREPPFYADNRIDLVLGASVVSIDTAEHAVQLSNGKRHTFDRLLIATGADPVRLNVPGAGDAGVHYLRTFADSKAIIAKVRPNMRAVVIGASFIGLEVAAALRARNVPVEVVAPDALPLERVMGPDIGRRIQRLHEEHGVRFHLGRTVTKIDRGSVAIDTGEALDADLVVAGIGVRPADALAVRTGLLTDRGVLVNEFLETSVPGIFAAGDAARWLDGKSGERRHVEHWVVAERQGQTAARNMLGGRVPFDSAPFFWSQHYDVTIRYVGYAEKWDAAEVDGNIDAGDCSVAFKRNGRTLAVATIGRDLDNLRMEETLER